MMKLLKAITIMYLVQFLGGSVFASTTINCSNQTGKMSTQFKFSSDPVSLSFETTYDGSHLPTYIFLNDKAACGQPLQLQDKCSVKEFKDAVHPGDYDFQFSCSDGRRGELHYENGTAMAYCYHGNALANQRGGDSCKISF